MAAAAGPNRALEQRRASELLWACWDAGSVLPGLPRACAPATRAEGYAIQALSAQRGHQVAGWKIAATSKAGQAHIGVDGPLAGQLFAHRCHGDGARISLTGNRMRVAECEFAFRMAADLPGRAAPYSRDEVLAAIGALHPAIEVPDSRVEKFETAGAPLLIADNACCRDFVLGAAMLADWRKLDLPAQPVTARVNGGAELRGSGANVLGDPITAMVWIANELSQLGVGLKAGQIVTSGASVTPIPVHPGDQVVADFGLIGQVSVTFI